MRPDGAEVANAGGDKPPRPPAFQIIVLVSVKRCMSISLCAALHDFHVVCRVANGTCSCTESKL